MIVENLRMALRSLAGAKLRSFLTMLGIIIGVAAVVAIVAIGQGVKDSVTKQVSSLGAGTLIITPGQSQPGHGSFGANLGASTLTQTDVNSLRHLSDIKAVAPVGLVSGIVRRGATVSVGTSIEATTSDLATIMNLKFSQGHFLIPTNTTDNVVVLGSTTKTDLFGAGPALGQTVLIRDRPFTVIGVVNASPNTLGANKQNLVVYLPYQAAQTLTGGSLSILQIAAQAANPQQISRAVDRVKQTLKTNHGGQTDFSVMTQSDLLATFNTILNLLTTFIGAIASISLLVGGIGIMNIMLVSVTERTREIGIRKALGATSRTVLGQFLIEALVLCLIGGALGLAAAYAMAYGAGKLAGISPGFSLASILLAVGISGGIGIIFGLAPAVKAARMKPIDALRYE